MRILAEGEKRLTNGFGMFDDIGDIPLDEIMALGAALTASSIVGWTMANELVRKSVEMADENYDQWKRYEAQRQELQAAVNEEFIRNLPAIMEKGNESAEIAIQLAEKITAGVITGGASTIIPAQRQITP